MLSPSMLKIELSCNLSLCEKVGGQCESLFGHSFICFSSRVTHTQG